MGTYLAFKYCKILYYAHHHNNILDAIMISGKRYRVAFKNKLLTLK